MPAGTVRDVRERLAGLFSVATLLMTGMAVCGCSTHDQSAAATTPTQVHAAVTPSNSPSASPSPAVPHKPKRLDRQRLTKAIDAYLAERASVVTVEMVDRTTGASFRYHPGGQYVTASAVKVDILMTLLLQRQRKHRGLTSAERSDASVMIRMSDNHAADRLYVKVGGASGVAAANRAFRLTSTRPVDGKCKDLLCWSLTQTTAKDQRRLLEVLLGPKSALNAKNRAYVLGLMGKVVKEESWGISAAARKGDKVALKNGWMTLQRDAEHWVIDSIGRVQGHGHDFLITVLTWHNPTDGYGITTIQHVVELAAKEFRKTTPWLEKIE
ncbi:MAG: serine hydrolase [Actinomycetia bacterium]|nr:serine hydrolase [Actinomycetes bacterium]